MMFLKDLEYPLPKELIAEIPAESRNSSRMLTISRENNIMEDKIFWEITEYFNPGDCVIFNNTRVMKARLTGICIDDQREVEILLVENIDGRSWKAMVKKSKKIKNGKKCVFSGIKADILERIEDSLRKITFEKEINFSDLERIGITPIPPYIVKKRKELNMPAYVEEDVEWYQSIFAKYFGSVAAPTASLHFTKELIDALVKKNVHIGYITLHVGPGTFKPIQGEIDDYKIHREWIDIPVETIDLIKKVKRSKRKITAIGTTTTRALETMALKGFKPYRGYTDLMIKPPFEFQIVDRLLTNFHLPLSSLLLLVFSFAGRAKIIKAYEHAIKEKYRFYSYGDAMLIY